MAEPLTRGQQVFASIVARETGLDPKVVGAWAKSEQSGSAAEFYDKSNYHNYLNIARTDGGDAKGSHSGVWSNPESAAKATAEWIKGQGPITKEYGKAAPGIRAILGTAGKDPASQIDAIGKSGWATAPDYGQKIGALYHELSGTQLKLLSAAQRAAGAFAGVAPVVPEASTAAPAKAPENPYTALMAIHTGASPIVEKNWQMLSHLFDQENPIRQPTEPKAPAIPLPGEEPQERAIKGHYINPIHGFTIGRTDMGVDASAPVGTPIRAMGNAEILGISPNWYQGQPYVFYELEDGPHKGQIIYVAEQITPTVKTGDKVAAGQEIGRFAPTGTGIEIGLGTRSPGGTLAQATTGYTEGQITKAGQQMHQILHEVGAL